MEAALRSAADAKAAELKGAQARHEISMAEMRSQMQSQMQSQVAEMRSRLISQQATSEAALLQAARGDSNPNPSPNPDPNANPNPSPKPDPNPNPSAAGGQREDGRVTRGAGQHAEALAPSS